MTQTQSWPNAAIKGVNWAWEALQLKDIRIGFRCWNTFIAHFSACRTQFWGLGNSRNLVTVCAACSSKITKKEYFYNLNSLDFSIFGGSDFTQSSWTSPSTRVVFTKFKYSEVDSIPFFNYYLDSTSQVDRIDRGFKTPTRATAPRIDYSRQDFDFIGNVTITL